MDFPLATAFLPLLRARDWGGELPPEQAVETLLAHALATARAAWPTVTILPSPLVAALAAHLPADAPFAEALGKLHVGDLALTCACAQGQPAALQALEARFLSQLPMLVGHIDRSPAFLDEVAQTLRERLLVRKGDCEPRITAYRGQGPLLGWLRAAAVRTALNLRRGKAVTSSQQLDETAARLLTPGDDPELDLIKVRYREEFQASLRAAFAALTDEQRNVLHMHLIGGLSTTRIGALFKVNHTTVSRWLAAARESIFDETRRLMSQRLRLRPEEFESLVRVLRSQLDLSLTGLLQSP